MKRTIENRLQYANIKNAIKQIKSWKIERIEF